MTANRKLVDWYEAAVTVLNAEGPEQVAWEAAVMLGAPNLPADRRERWQWVLDEATRRLARDHRTSGNQGV